MLHGVKYIDLVALMTHLGAKTERPLQGALIIHVNIRGGEERINWLLFTL